MAGLGRRELLILGGAAALGGPGLLSGSAEARTLLRPAAAGAVPDAVAAPDPEADGLRAPADQRGRRGWINLAGGSRVLLRKKKLHHASVLQSFAFDEDNGYIYALQVMEGGVRLKGESRAYTHAQRVSRGDLVVNRLTMSGKPRGRMFLTGFGHGGSIGVEERPGQAPLLWTEWNVNPGSGYGRGIARFGFTPGRVLKAGDRKLETFRPQPGSTKNQPAVDMTTRRLLLRYRRKGKYRYALYDLATFAAGVYRPLADIPQPIVHKGSFYQGMALSGDYAYQLTGGPFSATNPPAKRGNARITSIDLRSGAIVQDVRTLAGLSLRPREPEGLAVLHRGDPSLVVGLTSGKVNRRRFSLYEQGGSRGLF